MGKKIADDKVIVAEAKEKFGHLSDGIKNAVFLKELTVALRALAHTTASSAPATCNDVLNFCEQHKLSGI